MARKFFSWSATFVLIVVAMLHFFKPENLTFLSSVEKTGDIVDNSIPVVLKKEVVLEEAPDMSKSAHPIWWLNSGAYATLFEDEIRTVHGELPADDPWRQKYNASNPTETDDGYHPQNIFRLVSREKYAQATQSALARIDRYILSPDTHRAASNGILYFHHYQDGDNLYYAGVRVDGTAIIKKKQRGIYYTMASTPLFDGPKYDRDTNPNKLLTNSWFNLKTEITNLSASKVRIRVFVDLTATGSAQLVAEAIDDGKSFGGPAITKAGYAGIRTDFMDATIKGYEVQTADRN